jgi:hypothetical protein
MSKRTTIEAARLSLEGVGDVEIATTLHITVADLVEIRRSKSYKSSEKELARTLLEESEALLVALARQGLMRLKEALSTPLHNMDNSEGPGLQRRLADPSLIKEFRLSTQMLLSAALDASESDDDDDSDED